MKATILIAVFLSIGITAISQSQEEKILEFQRQREAADMQQLNTEMDSAILLSQQGKYEIADEKFRNLLKAMKSIPSNFVYHFGENSFHLGKYRQSVDWLNKYIQLKGTTGQYSQDAVAWLKKAEDELLKEKQQQSIQAREVLAQDYDIDCGPTGKVTCPVCKGSTVIIKKGYIEDTYRTCPYCNKLGFLKCEDYNLLLKGQLEPSGSNP